jgi:hypothetical protein
MKRIKILYGTEVWTASGEAAERVPLGKGAISGHAGNTH